MDDHLAIRKEIVQLGYEYTINGFRQAISEGDKPIVELFIKAGMDINKKLYSYIYDETPLITAALNMQLEIAKYFVEKGANVKLRNAEGKNLIDAAFWYILCSDDCRSRNADTDVESMVRYLIGIYPKPIPKEVLNNWLSNALTKYREKKLSKDFIKYLFNLGADIDKNMNEPLKEFARCDDNEMIDYAIKHGANVVEAYDHIAPNKGKQRLQPYLPDDHYDSDVYKNKREQSQIMKQQQKRQIKWIIIVVISILLIFFLVKIWLA